MTVPVTTSPIYTATHRVLAVLRKIDRLHLPTTSRRDIESILVRQVTYELDQALPHLSGHGRRTAVVAARLGQEMGLETAALHDLKLAAWLHDIGLLFLPHEIVTTTGELRLEHRVAIQNHSRSGAALLESFSFLKHASVFVAHHHERWDGTGYPYGIRGPFIPLEARLLSVADAFDAITVPDVTCPKRRDSVALRILKVASGTQFDPDIVHLLGRCLDSPRILDRPVRSNHHPLRFHLCVDEDAI